jgi:hypothetical protein
MANKTVHGLMQEVDEQKKKQKALADENDQLKSKVKELDKENTKADAIIADREAYIKQIEGNAEFHQTYIKQLESMRRADQEDCRELKIQIKKLTNDLEEAKLNNSSANTGLKFGSLLDRWNSEGRKLSLSSVPIGGYLDLSNSTPPQTDAQKILNILKQLEPERMVFEFSQVSKEVSRIIADNKTKSASVSELFNKIS